ncbi:MAG TPA: arginase family protein [Gaiellaceae bacterium]|nr:arginase family protein [Gaiellaceae bacterium]
MNQSVRDLIVIDAPSNLGLRPPQEGVAPGVYKLAGALRDCEIVGRLGAEDGGVVTPPRYEPTGRGREPAIADYSLRLATRVEDALDRALFPIVLGGDCSILLGNALALRRRGRYGLVYIDAHSDFRHPRNSRRVGAVAGEDLALVTGRGDALADLGGLRPLIRDDDVVTIGIREEDPYLQELRDAGMTIAEGAAFPDRRYWVHFDVDALDASLMPAVDSPEPDGLNWEEAERVLHEVLWSGRAVGLEVTIFDPDLDPTGELADRLADLLVRAIGGEPQPELPLQGGCLCGGVRFELTAPFRRANHCHCSYCRRHSGTFGLSQGRVPREGFRFLAGEELVRHYRPADGASVKAFCSVCGSSLFGGTWPEGPEVSVRLGALDGDPGIRPQYHSWVGSRAAWDVLPPDGLPRFPERPPSA